MPTGELYGAANNNFTVANINSPGDLYPVDFNHSSSDKIAQRLKFEIYDVAPRGFNDLKILGMKAFKSGEPRSEFHYKSMGWQRAPITANGTAVGVTSPTPQTFAITDMKTVNKGLHILYPNDSTGTITALDTALNTITVTPQTGQTLPAVAAAEVFQNLNNMYEDGQDGINQYFRAETKSKSNFITWLDKGRRYDTQELYEIKHASTTNFMDKERQAMMTQFRVDQSNLMWHSKKGEVKMPSGKFQKTTDGLWNDMMQNGSLSTTATSASIRASIENIALKLDGSDTKFVFATPERILQLSQSYKTAPTRYVPADKAVNLNIEVMQVGDTTLVFTPIRRWSDRSSFSTQWENRYILYDMDQLDVRQMVGHTQYKFGDRSGGNPRNYEEEYLQTSLGFEFNNSLANGYVTIT